MPKLGLALSAAAAGPLRMPAGDLAPTGMPSGSGSGSDSGSSGAGIGEFLYSDKNILKMWLSDESQASGIPAMDTTEGNAILMWRDRSRNANVAQSYNHIANAPIAVPESVTVSGAVVSNPGGYALPVNGTYVRNGSKNGRPKYEKNSGDGGVLQISWENGYWGLNYNGRPSDGMYAIINNSLNGVWFASNNSIAGGIYGAFSGTPTVTWSPAHASFDGTQYLTIPNPLTGDSAEVFVVCKFDPLTVGQMNGPLIGNLGVSQEYERWLRYQDDSIDGYRVRVAFARASLTQANFSGFGNDGLGFYIPPNLFENENWILLYFSSQNSNFYVSADNIAPLGLGGHFSRLTYNNEGPYIGRSTQGGDIKFKGKIAEIMLYNRALTVSERTVVQNYLNQKYSLWV